MSALRHARLFRNGRNQAVRIPVEFELPGDEVTIRRDGEALILEPIHKKLSLLEWLDTLDPIDEEFPEIDDPPPKPITCFD